MHLKLHTIMLRKSARALILFSKLWVGAYLRVGAYSRQRFGGHSFNNPVSRVGAYLRLGAYSRVALNRSITVFVFIVSQ